MQIKLDLKKTVEQNAVTYFESAKKAKRKLEGAKKAILVTQAKLARLEEGIETVKAKKQEEQKFKERKKEWYEKFRWFISSEGFLVIGGRDATTNEIIIKKHTNPEDLVFHTEMAGSPFVVIKTEGKAVGDETIEEAAQFTASFSKAWKAGFPASEVFLVKPEQVSKEANAGEYMTKGAFMIRGKKDFIGTKLGIAIGNYNNSVMVGPLSAIKKHCKNYVVIKQSQDTKSKTSDLAKKIKHKIDCELDEIIRSIPEGSEMGKE